jgi:hypothetical protein
MVGPFWVIETDGRAAIIARAVLLKRADMDSASKTTSFR